MKDTRSQITSSSAPGGTACAACVSARVGQACWLALALRALALLLVVDMFAIAQETNRAASSTANPNATQPDYSSFRVITERNIFAARRSGRTMSTRMRAPAPRPAETITLVGTLLSENGPVAFFDSTASEHRKAVKPGGNIAGYRVAEIEFNRVRLEADAQSVDLNVGAQLRRQDDGAWRPVGAGELLAGTTTGASSSTADPGEAAERSSSGTESDVLRRLMQQREQELQ